MFQILLCRTCHKGTRLYKSLSYNGLSTVSDITSASFQVFIFYVNDARFSPGVFKFCIKSFICRYCKSSFKTGVLLYINLLRLLSIFTTASFFNEISANILLYLISLFIFWQRFRNFWRLIILHISAFQIQFLTCACHSTTHIVARPCCQA